jgi:hypothetical protein
MRVPCTETGDVVLLRIPGWKPGVVDQARSSFMIRWIECERRCCSPKHHHCCQRHDYQDSFHVKLNLPSMHIACIVFALRDWHSLSVNFQCQLPVLMG